MLNAMYTPLGFLLGFSFFQKHFSVKYFLWLGPRPVLDLPSVIIIGERGLES